MIITLGELESLSYADRPFAADDLHEASLPKATDVTDEEEETISKVIEKQRKESSDKLKEDLGEDGDDKKKKKKADSDGEDDADADSETEDDDMEDF